MRLRGGRTGREILVKNGFCEVFNFWYDPLFKFMKFLLFFIEISVCFAVTVIFAVLIYFIFHILN